MAKFSGQYRGGIALAREIENVVLAPYPVSLENLRDILSQTSRAALFEWVDGNSSHVRPLAQALLEALDFWPCALDVLTVFARVTPLRDALLNESPQLIQAILKDAISSKTDFDSKALVCVAFLAEPLPDGVALPALAQTFLFTLSNRAYKNPCTATIEPIFDVLSGACSSLPHMLSEVHLSTLETHVKHMMRSNEGPEAQLATMLSILILAKIPSRSVLPGDARHDCFVGENGAKTMNLVTWQVLHACRMDGSLDCPERHIKLSRLVIGHIEPGTICEWAEKNPRFADKLWQKLSLPNLPRSVNIETFAFATTFLDTPQACIETFESEYLADCQILNMGQEEFSAFLRTMEMLSSVLTIQAWTAFLSNIDAAVTRIMVASPQAHKNMLRLLHTLQRHAATSKTLRLGTLSILCDKKDVSSLNGFCSTPHPVSQVCVDIQASYIGFILSAAILSEEREQNIPTPILAHLLQKQQQLCQMSGPKTLSLQRPSGPDVTGTQKTTTSSPKGILWKSRVADEVKTYADRCGERVLELFGEAVSDLESRCQNAEEPLRVEQAKLEASERERVQLQAQVTRLQEELILAKNGEKQSRNDKASFEGRIAQLETEAISAKHTKEKLQSDNDLLSSKVDETSEELNTHVKLVEELERQLAESTDEAAQTLESVRKANNLESITLSSRIAAQVDEIETLECITTKLKQELRASQSTCAQMQRDAEASASEAAVATQRSLTIEAELESLKPKLLAVQAQLGQALDNLEGLRLEKDEEHRQIVSKRDELLARGKEEAMKAREEFESQLQIAKKGSAEASMAVSNAQGLAESLEARLDKAQHDNEQAAARHTEVIESKERQLDGFKRKLRQLGEERDRASAQVAKFQANLKQMLGGDLGKSEGPSETAVAMSQALLAESQATGDMESSFAETEASSTPALAKMTKQSTRPFKAPSRQPGATTQTRRSTRSQAVLVDISPNKRLALESPARQKRQSIAKAATGRRSVRHSFAVASEQAENAEATCTGFEDEFDDTTCDF